MNAMATDDAAATGVETPEALTKAFFERLKAVKQRYATDRVIIVRGVRLEYGEDEEEEDEEDEDEEEGANRTYTAEQLARLRYVILTSRRNRMIEEAMDFVTCGQAEEFFMMFNTSDGNKVCLGIARRVTKALKLKTLPQQFDSLFGLTFALSEEDHWLDDNEYYERNGALEKGLKALAKAWKKLLANTDADLGIDSEYTRAGTEGCLEIMEEIVGEQERGEDKDGYEFNWR
jgi:hypothetical protein